MYTAKLIKRDIDQGRYKWTVDFTNGEKTWTEFFFDGKYEQVRSKVALKLKELNEADTFTEGQDIDATIAAPTAKTQAELDMDVWFKDWRKFKHATELVDLGIIAGTLPAYLALKTKLSTNFKPVYVTFM